MWFGSPDARFFSASHGDTAGVGFSKMGGAPKSSTLKGFSIIKHPSWGTSNFGKPPNGESLGDMIMGLLMWDSPNHLPFADGQPCSWENFIGGFKVCEPSWNDATTNQSILLFFPHIYQSFSGIAMQKCTNWWMIPGLYGVLIS